MNSNRRQWLRKMFGAAAAATVGARASLADDGTKPRRVRVLSFNILVGGTRFEPLERTAEVIAASKADVVGLQEVGQSGPKLAEMTGFHRHARGSSAILSRWPIVGRSPKEYGVRIRVPGRGDLWAFNTHLAPAPYQPYQLAGIPYGSGNPFIETAGEAIAEAIRARGQQLAELLMDMAQPLRDGTPLVLTGDFNEPSHLDWTRRAAEGKRVPIAVAWPTSRSLVDAGLTDAYRTAFPNELEHPGHTWTPRPAKRDVPDRIDLVYTRGLVARTAGVIGESRENADVVVTPYPSDHRAVFAELAWPA